MRPKVINHKANRKRAALKNTLIFPGQKSEDIVHGDGASKQCFEPNSNYKSLFFKYVVFTSLCL